MSSIARHGPAPDCPKGQPLTLRRHEGFDHGPFVIESVVDHHLRLHAHVLTT